MQFSFSLRDFREFFRLLIRTSLLLIVVLMVFLEASFCSSIAHAAAGNGPQFGLQPVMYDPANPLTKSYFIFDGKTESILKSRVRVINTGTARGSVSLFPVDATTGQTSGAVYLNGDDPRKDVGAWIVLGVQQLTLDPGQSQIIPFQITIPATAHSGQHLGGIVAENLAQQSNTSTTNSKKNTSTFQINIKNQTIIAVQVNLPGMLVEQLAGTGIQTGGENGYQRLFVGLSNTGTVMLKPSGTLQVTDAQGHVVKHFSLKLDTLLPQTAINFPIAITGQALDVGDYKATLNLTYGHGKELNSITRFSITREQLTKVFSSSRTQAPPGLGDGFAGMPLWQLLLVAGGGLVLLWTGGNKAYKRIVVFRLRAKLTSSVK